MDFFIKRLPHKVFDNSFYTEVYKYDLVFFSENIDVFFNALEAFLKAQNENQFMVKCLHGCEDLNKILLSNLLDGSKLIDFSFAAHWREFVIVGHLGNWGIYCNREFEWVIFGVQEMALVNYRFFFTNNELDKLKYLDADAAVNNVPLKLAYSKNPHFVNELKNNYKS